MKDPLSQNEKRTLERQMATVTYQMNEIAHLLEVRLGDTNDLAGSARLVSDQVKKLADRIKRQNALQQESGSGHPLSSAQTG
jgi:hypothetical protein